MGHMTDRATMRNTMVEKRLRKIKAIESVIMKPVYAGDENADITLVTWGTTKGSVIMAMEALRSQGKKVAVITYPWIYPFPATETKALLGTAKRIVDVEQNATGQLAHLIRSETGIEVTEKLLKYDGRPWLPEEIVSKLI